MLHDRAAVNVERGHEDVFDMSLGRISGVLRFASSRFGIESRGTIAQRATARRVPRTTGGAPVDDGRGRGEAGMAIGLGRIGGGRKREGGIVSRSVGK